MTIEEISVICGCILICVFLIAKSKCSTLDCWGVHIVRDVGLEEKAHEFDVEHGVREIPKITDVISL